MRRLLGLGPDTLREALEPWIDQPYRARQVFEAIYERGLADLGEIHVLPARVRRELSAHVEVGRLEVAERHASSDGTVKALFRLPDGATVEAVDIPTPRRRTLCLSSQAGCALACRFCVTGYWGAGRNLEAGEIVGQALGLLGRFEAQDSVNLVFMGMGEPMLNLEAVRQSIELMTRWISWRRITVSTVGIVPGIEEMAGWSQRPNLAISLHAPRSDLRARIMPVERNYPLERLLETLESYPLESGRRLTIEYILIRDFNDSDREARELAALMKRLDAKVNLIPMNPDPVLGADLVAPEEAAIARFAARLRSEGLTVTIRQRRGDAVSAACGQLRAPGRDPRGFRRSNYGV